MDCDVSVVIPLYNAEKYVRQCVDSVLAQTLDSVEILLVDDCSPDNGVALCEQLYGGNEHVRILRHDKNQGPGAARNTGTLNASGRYICYVDSDDEIMPGYLSGMLSAALEYDADVVHSTHCFTAMPGEDGAAPPEMQGLPEGQLLLLSPDRKEFPELTLLDDDLNARFEEWAVRSYHCAVWNNIYRKSFLMEHSIRFGSMRLAEDMVFFFQCLFNARRFVVRPGGGYIYRITDTSLSRAGKSPEGTVKALRAQLELIGHMKRIMETIPFFRNNSLLAGRAIDTVLLDLENGFIKPAFQSLGEDGMRAGGAVHSFFAEYFGDTTPYVEFLFYELHKLYAPVPDYVGASANPDEWREIIKK